MSTILKNRVTLPDIDDHSLDDLAALPLDQLALLVEDADTAYLRAKTRRAKLANGCALKLGASLGTTRDGPITVSISKRVEWDQAGLEGLADPAITATTKRTVSERDYTAMPPARKAALEPFRTVRPGAPSVRVSS